MTTRKQPERPLLSRTFDLIDYEVSRAGDGRTVTAYAATFGQPYEVADQHGHYFESINRSAFNRQLNSQGTRGVKVLVNHGMTPFGTPSERFSLPIGTPVSITPDAKGLLTVTRYSETDLADEMLELWRSGAITSQSFRGPIYDKPNPTRHSSGLPLIERMSLGLKDYGPATFEVNIGAELVSIRSEVLTDPTSLLTVAPDELTDEDREQLRQLLETPGTASPEAPANDQGTPPPPADEAPATDQLGLTQAEQDQRRRRQALETERSGQ